MRWSHAPPSVRKNRLKKISSVLSSPNWRSASVRGISQLLSWTDEQTCCWCAKTNKASWFWALSRVCQRENMFGYNLCAGGGAVQAEQPGEAWPDSVLQDGRWGGHRHLRQPGRNGCSSQLSLDWNLFCTELRVYDPDRLTTKCQGGFCVKGKPGIARKQDSPWKKSQLHIFLKPDDHFLCQVIKWWIMKHGKTKMVFHLDIIKPGRKTQLRKNHAQPRRKWGLKCDSYPAFLISLPLTRLNWKF